MNDSFWFCVLFYRYTNREKSIFINKENDAEFESLKLKTFEIIKRVSFNFFKFFIIICEEKKKKMPSNIKKDLILVVYNDFLTNLSIIY